MKHKKPHIGYIDIPADNIERSRKFYSEVFEWTFEKDFTKIPASPQSEYYHFYNPSDAHDRQPESKSKYLGGMARRLYPTQPIIVYIDVPSIDDYLKKITEHGGRVIEEKKAVPGLGFFATCADPENNIFALWEENHEAK